MTNQPLGVSDNANFDEITIKNAKSLMFRLNSLAENNRNLIESESLELAALINSLGDDFLRRFEIENPLDLVLGNPLSSRKIEELRIYLCDFFLEDSILISSPASTLNAYNLLSVLKDRFEERTIRVLIAGASTQSSVNELKSILSIYGFNNLEIVVADIDINGLESLRNSGIDLRLADLTNLVDIASLKGNSEGYDIVFTHAIMDKIRKNSENEGVMAFDIDPEEFLAMLSKLLSSEGVIYCVELSENIGGLTEIPLDEAQSLQRVRGTEAPRSYRLASVHGEAVRALISKDDSRINAVDYDSDSKSFSVRVFEKVS